MSQNIARAGEVRYRGRRHETLSNNRHINQHATLKLGHGQIPISEIPAANQRISFTLSKRVDIPTGMHVHLPIIVSNASNAAKRQREKKEQRAKEKQFFLKVPKELKRAAQESYASNVNFFFVLPIHGEASKKSRPLME